MTEEKSKINCPIFQEQEPLIKDITQKMNFFNDVKLKAIYAEDLLKKADALLSCSDYDGKNLDCKNCRFVTSLRKSTADIIIKAKKLA
jgi:hypothetical protein